MNLSRVKCFGDSDLVAQQVSGTWDSKDPLMAAYRREVDIVAGYFRGYQVDHVDRRKNEAADALSRLLSAQTGPAQCFSGCAAQPVGQDPW